MSNNINIEKFDDLAIKLKNSKDLNIVLLITINNTDDKLKQLLNNFISKKSNIYPDVTFLNYCAKDSDFGKMPPIFDNYINMYPRLFHIYNGGVLSCTMKINNIEILEKSFKDLHDYYIEHATNNCNETKYDSQKFEVDESIQIIL